MSWVLRSEGFIRVCSKGGIHRSSKVVEGMVEEEGSSAIGGCSLMMGVEGVDVGVGDTSVRLGTVAVVGVGVGSVRVAGSYL